MEFAIIDIETTSLDTDNASIIEVGAVLVRDGSIKGKYSSFVAYDGEIPETVKRKTGIREDMLLDAPQIQDVIAKLGAFIGKRPVVAHNGYNFDFPILARHGLKVEERIDSMEIAFFVLPTSITGHSMQALAEQFRLSEVEHRALSDCEMTFRIIEYLLAEHGRKPKKIREALNHLAAQSGWWWAPFLPGRAAPFNLISDLIPKFEPYRKKNPQQEVIAFQTKPINLAEVDKYFIPQGGDSDEDYSEDRPEQREMAKLIAESFNERRHAVIEAGTGTGKSKAYLVPALLFAQKNNIPLVVSTHTKVLQDQLFTKEIKHVRDTINKDLQVAVLKGRMNYVCLDKFDKFLDEVSQHSQQRSLYESTTGGVEFTSRLAALLLSSWALETERGDWEEVSYWLKDKLPKRVEEDICNKDELCNKGICDLFDAEKCFLAKAKLRARDADLVVINHAISLIGITVDEKILASEDDRPPEERPKPVYGHTVFPGEAKFIIFDEVHYLEDDATTAWEKEINEAGMRLLMRQVFDKRGALGTIKSLAERRANKQLSAWANQYENAAGEVSVQVDALFRKILPPLAPRREKEFGSVYRMLDEMKNDDPEKKDLLDIGKILRMRLFDARRIIGLVADEADNPKIRNILAARANILARTIDALDAILGKDAQFVRYIERLGTAISVKASPISVAPYLKRFVYDNFDSVIMTSATITVNKRFDFFSKRCGTGLVPEDKMRYQFFNSSFDYRKQCKFFVPEGIAYGDKAKDHLERCGDFLEQALIASRGGALILCSSHSQVDALYERLQRPLSRENIWLLRQPKGGSSTSVIRDFKRDTDSVLIGTKTLWQGVDVPGDSLRALFIVKIPYDRPDNPLIKARREEIEREKMRSYEEYYEPLAAIAVKQGFGRLIRKKSDTGIAVLLDANVMKKKRIIGSLPDGVEPKAVAPAVICDELRAQANESRDRTRAIPAESA